MPIIIEFSPHWRNNLASKLSELFPIDSHKKLTYEQKIIETLNSLSAIGDGSTLSKSANYVREVFYGNGIKPTKIIIDNLRFENNYFAILLIAQNNTYQCKCDFTFNSNFDLSEARPPLPPSQVPASPQASPKIFSSSPRSAFNKPAPKSPSSRPVGNTTNDSDSKTFCP